MAISHKDHDHPNTPAARAACRKAMAKDGTSVKISAERALAESAGLIKPAKMTVVPRRRGDGGVIKGMQATAPKVAVRQLKVSGTLIRREYDLADVPRDLATGVRMAWKLDWDVQVGHPFNEDERRIVVAGEVAEVALVWDSNGRTGFFVRSWDSSITRKVDNPIKAFEFASSADNWPWRGPNHELL